MYTILRVPLFLHIYTYIYIYDVYTHTRINNIRIRGSSIPSPMNEIEAANIVSFKANASGV